MKRVTTFTLVLEWWALGVGYSVNRHKDGLEEDLGHFSSYCPVPKWAHTLPQPPSPPSKPLWGNPMRNCHSLLELFFHREREKQAHSACRTLGEGAGRVWGLACLPRAWPRCLYQHCQPWGCTSFEIRWKARSTCDFLMSHKREKCEHKWKKERPRKRKKEKPPQLENEQLFWGPLSCCQASSFNLFCFSISVSLSLFFLCPSLTWPLTFSLEFLWKICKFTLLPLGSKINCTIPT